MYDELVNTIILFEKRSLDDVWIERLRTVSSIILHERRVTDDMIDNMKRNPFLTIPCENFFHCKLFLSGLEELNLLKAA